eukprot:gene4806-104_t
MTTWMKTWMTTGMTYIRSGPETTTEQTPVTLEFGHHWVITAMVAITAYYLRLRRTMNTTTSTIPPLLRLLFVSLQ